ARSGDYAQAEKERAAAYLIYEGSMEHRLDSRNQDLAHEIEAMFWSGSASQPGLASLIAANAPADQLSARADGIHDEMQEAQGFLGSSMTPLVAFLNSMAIIIREGL